jgi:CRP/FNR family transcriptional regulator, cyclic AMP receptor protein
MTRPLILDTFATHEFLSKLDDRCLMDLASGVRPFAVAAGGYLGRRDQPANAFYLIQAGTVLVGDEQPDGELAPLMTIGPGGVVGWSWLVPPHRWHFTCRAETPVQGLMFDAAWLRDRCEQNHELGYHLLKELLGALAGRLVASREERGKVSEVA